MSTTPGVTVHMRHIRAADLCAHGTREWFVKHGFDWGDFLNNGIPIERMEATGDPLAMRVTEQARLESNNGR